MNLAHSFIHGIAWICGCRVTFVCKQPLARVALPYTRLSLDDWRSSPERVAFVAELLHQPLFLDLLGVLSSFRLFQRGPLDATSAAILLGQRQGQDQVIAALLAAATPAATAPAELPPADYSAENVMHQWDDETSGASQ